jgi:glycosyltransferase involved in cell wall biosynthesis
MKIGFIAADRGGSAFYRIIQPSFICKSLYEDVHFSQAGKVTYKLLEESDIIIIQRQESDSALKGMMKQKKQGKFMMTDIDDNIWSIPNGIVDLKTFWTKERVKGFEQSLEICDAITTTTPLLAKNIRKFNKNVFILPNLVDSFEFTKPENKVVRIGWGGSATHLPDFTVDIIKTLLKLKEEYKTKIELVMIGVVPLDLIGYSTFYRFTPPYEYLRFLRELNLDIGLIPCANNFFNDGRSNVKYVEWSAIKAATVASPAASYSSIIQHGITGFLTYRPKQWYEYLKLLIEDKDLRIKVSQNAFNFVHEHYSIKKKHNQYKLYGELYERKKDDNLDFDAK